MGAIPPAGRPGRAKRLQCELIGEAPRISDKTSLPLLLLLLAVSAPSFYSLAWGGKPPPDALLSLDFWLAAILTLLGNLLYGRWRKLAEFLGGEIMAMIQIAMMGGLRYTALRDVVFAHPTLAER